MLCRAAYCLPFFCNQLWLFVDELMLHTWYSTCILFVGKTIIGIEVYSVCLCFETTGVCNLFMCMLNIYGVCITPAIANKEQ